jgi:hypothetical protein
MLAQTFHAPPRTVSHIRYVIILAFILAVLVFFFVAQGVVDNLDNQSAPIQKSSNETNGTVQNGTSTTDTNTPADRSVPSTSGGDSNSLQQP